MLYNMRAQISRDKQQARALKQGATICPECNGDGDIPPQEHFGRWETCWECNGTGTVSEREDGNETND